MRLSHGLIHGGCNHGCTCPGGSVGIIVNAIVYNKSKKCLDVFGGMLCSAQLKAAGAWAICEFNIQ
jgi:hypothetical protein